MRGYGSTPGATSREQAILTRLAEAERRTADPWVRARLDEAVELVRELIAGRRDRVDFELAQDHDDSGVGFVPDPDWVE